MPVDPAEVKAIFLEAVAIDNEVDRNALVYKRCRNEEELFARVNALLVANDRAMVHEGTASFDGDRIENPNPSMTQSNQEIKTERPHENEIAGMIVGGKYKLLEEIGDGGMGTVWMAEQSEPVRRTVAVKLIKPGMDSKQVLARFDAERQALAMMDHPIIAKVHDAGTTTEGRPYFVMELVKGVPITKYCDEHKLTPHQRLELFVPVCQAIQHAHQKGIIHRDIKPSNVLVAMYDDRPVPKVIDFGVAKATGVQLTEQTLNTGFGTVVGTVEYMSPEQAGFNQLDIDTRSDIYSLGVLLYELLTGTTPLTRKRAKEAALLEILRLVREEEPPKPSTRLSSTAELPSIAAVRGMEPARLSKLIRGDLDWIVMKALEKDRSRRYETANGFAADIQRYIGGEAVQAVPPSALYRFRKFTKRNKIALTIGSALAIALLITLVTLIVSSALTSKAYQAERIAHKQSERNFEQTRSAVDEFFNTVSQSKLLNVPGLQSLRRELLESAVQFQQTLSTERPHDPTVQADLAKSHLRLAIMYFEVDQNEKCFSSMLNGLDIAEQLHRDHPEDQALMRRMAGFFTAHRPISGHTRVPKDYLGFEKVLERFVVLWDDLIRKDPAAISFRKDLAAMLAFRAGYRNPNRGFAESAADARRSISLLEGLLREHPNEPELLSMLAHNYSTLAFHPQPIVSKEEVKAANEKALLIREQLFRDHNIAEYRAHYLDRMRVKIKGHIEQGQFSEAERHCRNVIQDFNRLIDEFPHVTRYRYQFVEVLGYQAACEVKRDHKPGAVTILKRASDVLTKAVANDPGPIDAINLADALTRIKQNYLSLGMKAEADHFYRLTIDLFLEHRTKFNYKYRVQFGHTCRGTGHYFQHSGRPREALLYYRHALSAFQDLRREDLKHVEHWHFIADTYRFMAQCHSALKEFPEADAAYRTCVETHLERFKKLPGLPFSIAEFTNAFTEYSHFLATQQHTLEAEKYLHYPLELYPDSADIHNYVGMAYQSHGNRIRALELFQKTVEINNRHAWAYVNIGLIHDHNKQLDKAREAFQKAVDNGHTYTFAHAALGSVLFRKDNVDEAIPRLRTAISLIRNGDAIARNYLSSNLNFVASELITNPKWKDRAPTIAVEFGKVAVQLRSVAAYWNTLGKAHYRAGEYPDAIIALEQSMKLNSSGGAHDWFFLAMAHWKLGEKEEANKWYLKAIEEVKKKKPNDALLIRFRSEAAELMGKTIPAEREQLPIPQGAVPKSISN
jgi:serine/threonine protein kinase/tetratricopeptide (TPR) repeat protein